MELSVSTNGKGELIDMTYRELWPKYSFMRLHPDDRWERDKEVNHYTKQHPIAMIEVGRSTYSTNEHQRGTEEPNKMIKMSDWHIYIQSRNPASVGREAIYMPIEEFIRLRDAMSEVIDEELEKRKE